MISKEMWASIDETISPEERKIFSGIGVASLVHSIGVWIAGDGFNSNSMIGHLAYNGGDFYDGYLMSIMTEVLSKVFFRKMPASLRRGISSLGGILAVVLNETELFPLHRGTADIADMPAGLLGVACYLGVSLWANRRYQDAQTEKPPSQNYLPTSYLPTSDVGMHSSGSMDISYKCGSPSSLSSTKD